MLNPTRSAGSARLVLLAAVLALASTACKPKETKDPEPGPIDQLNSDLAQLRGSSHPGFVNFDQTSGGTFSHVFGGPTTADAVNYLDTRLHHYFDPADPSVTLSPRGILGPDPFGADAQKMGKGLVLGAANIGAALWFSSVMNTIPVVFNYQGQSVPIDSTRAGVMMIGPGYMQNHQKTRDGTDFTIPPEYRQAILFHEARHSDCSGGLTADQILNARMSPDTGLSGISCAHTHVKCPVGHPYEGQPACDNEPWGAYTVGEMFYRGVRDDPAMDSQSNSIPWQIANIVIADDESRVLVPRTGTADMSSEGVK